MREDIRLGNEALTRQDLDTARQYFQQVLVSDDATVMQKRIAANRLREIDERQQPAAEPHPRSPGKTADASENHRRQTAGRGPCASLCPSP